MNAQEYEIITNEDIQEHERIRQQNIQSKNPLPPAFRSVQLNDSERQFYAPPPVFPVGGVTYCLGEGTQVLTEDGYKSIELVKISDMVYSGRNQLTPVLEVVIDNCKNRILFQINGIIATADHLFMTTKGWACAMPEAYKNRIGKFLPSTKGDIYSLDSILTENISQLEIGDVLITQSGTVTVDTLQQVESIDGKFNVYAVVTEMGSLVIDEGIIVDAYGNASAESFELTSTMKAL